MQLGGSKYKQCPSCWKKNEYSIGPYFVHFFGFHEWSDGETFSEIPVLQKSKLQRCHYCGYFYWFKCSNGLLFNDFVEALAYFEKKYSKISLRNFCFRLRNNNDLLYIRLNILRKYNDRIRNFPRGSFDYEYTVIPERITEIFLNNARALLKILEKKIPKNHLMMAELYRNLGEFDKSKSILDTLPDSNLKLLHLDAIEKRNVGVIKVKGKEDEPIDLETHIILCKPNLKFIKTFRLNYIINKKYMHLCCSESSTKIITL